MLMISDCINILNFNVLSIITNIELFTLQNKKQIKMLNNNKIGIW